MHSPMLNHQATMAKVPIHQLWNGTDVVISAEMEEPRDIKSLELWPLLIHDINISYDIVTIVNNNHGW